MLENLCTNCFEDKDKKGICIHCGYIGEENKDPAVLKQGTILNAKYMVGKSIGRGGFGVTYLGFDLNLHLRVCIKEYFPDSLATRKLGTNNLLAFSGDARESFDYGKDKFVEEGRTLARFNPISTIVTVHDFFLENDTAYLVMEYLSGINLSQYLKRKSENKISWDETKEIILPVAKALSHVHKKGILHRDIAPDNIFITAEGEIKLLDFGAARFAMSEKSKSLSVILKQGYAPPEQYSSNGKQGVWTDVYALCATIYRCLTGKSPEESIDRMGGEPLDAISNYVQIPAHIERAIDKGLNISYIDRFSDIQDLIRFINDTSTAENDSVKPELVKIPNNNLTAHEQLRQAKIALEKKNKETARKTREEEEKERAATERFMERKWREPYNYALEVLAGGQYEKAYNMFLQFGDFDNSKEFAKQSKVLWDEQKYQRAIKETNKTSALKIFNELGDYKDAKEHSRAITDEVNKEKYKQAVQAFKKKKFGDAKWYFSDLENYKDTEKYLSKIKKRKHAKKLRVAGIFAVILVVVLIINNIIIPISKYNQAIQLQEDGEHQKAIGYFMQAKGYEDSREIVANYISEINKTSISAGISHTVGLKEDGSVVAIGSVIYGQKDVAKWNNILSISAGDHHTVGIKSDRSVIAVGSNEYGQCNVESWENIVSISAGGYHTVGLKSDGSVVATGSNVNGQCNISNWKDIVSVSAGIYHTVGIKSDGSVVATGSNYYGQCDLSSWKDIISISAGKDYTVGLKTNGTVISVGKNNYGQCNLSDWNDIISISTGREHTVGLKRDGTVVAVGRNDYEQCNISSWRNIVKIATGAYHTVGLKKDGTVITVGRSEQCQCNTEDWKDIKLN